MVWLSHEKGHAPGHRRGGRRRDGQRKGDIKSVAVRSKGQLLASQSVLTGTATITARTQGRRTRAKTAPTEPGTSRTGNHSHTVERSKSKSNSNSNWMEAVAALESLTTGQPLALRGARRTEHNTPTSPLSRSKSCAFECFCFSQSRFISCCKTGEIFLGLVGLLTYSDSQFKIQAHA